MSGDDKLSKTEMQKHLAWLENEIDQCLQYDLPFNHLEEERKELATLLSIDTGRHNLWASTCGYYHRMVENIKDWKQFH